MIPEKSRGWYDFIDDKRQKIIFDNW